MNDSSRKKSDPVEIALITGTGDEFNKNNVKRCRLVFSALGPAVDISLAAAKYLQEDLNKIELLEEQDDFNTIEKGSLHDVRPDAAPPDWVDVGHYLTENYDPQTGTGVYFVFTFNGTGTETLVSLPVLRELRTALNLTINQSERAEERGGEDDSCRGDAIGLGRD